MWRKTRRVSKKRRRHTKKRRNVKRTHKYKYLRGGLGENDYANIGIRDTYIFQSGCTQPGGGGDKSTRIEKIEEFEKYVFGTMEHADKWKTILRLCQDKGIPFYVLTSGGKVGIIRMLQLLELSDMVTEVLCNNNKSIDSNPENITVTTRNGFKIMNKYQIIQKILEERNISQDSKGIFIDNENANRIDSELCSNIAFELATGDHINKDQDETHTRFGSFVSNESLIFGTRIRGQAPILYMKNKSNLVSITVLDSIIDKINTDDKIKVIFSDFDGTMSPWRGALPFHYTDFNDRFSSHFNVSKLAL
jgi:2-hydroxy-3-keto-5-methylthiopentenyl-1-phosphate phosphatase